MLASVPNNNRPGMVPVLCVLARLHTFEPVTKGLECSHIYVESYKYDQKLVFSVGLRNIPLDDFSYCK